MKKKAPISTRHYRQIGVHVDHLLDDIPKSRTMLGELYHSERCNQKLNEETIHLDNCAFESKYIGNMTIEFEINRSHSGNILEICLDANAVEFMPRIMIKETANGREMSFITFDAIIKNKELWDSF